MSKAEHWQLEGGEAELYERHLVTAVTALWAADLVERVDVRAGDRVLDVACGTGVVARQAQRLSHGVPSASAGPGPHVPAPARRTAGSGAGPTRAAACPGRCRP